jgi:hypothetical protein
MKSPTTSVAHDSPLREPGDVDLELRGVRDAPATRSPSTASTRLLRSAGVVTALAAMAYQSIYVVRWAIDIPRSDEWPLFDVHMPHFQPIPSLEWLLSSNGSHRIPLARLLYVLMYYVDGMNFGHIKLVNYVFFAATVFLLTGLKDVTITPDRFPLFPLFLVFLFSPIDVENHTWAYQSQVHFVVFFQILAVYFGFRERRRPRDDLWFFLSCVCAMYSFASGLAVSGVLTGALIVRSLLSWRAGDGSAGACVRALVVGIGILGVALFWMHDIPQSHASVDLLLAANFWKFLLNLISHGQGFEESLSLVPGLLLVAVVFAAACLLLGTPEYRRRSANWVWVCLALSTIGGLFVVTLGRFGDYNGHYEAAKTSRYSELAFVLVPAVAMLLDQSLQEHTGLRRVALASYFAFLICGYNSNWDYTAYQYIADGQIKASQLVESYYAGDSSDAFFPFVAPWPLKDNLDYATRMKVHFAQSMAERYHREDLLNSPGDHTP